MIASCQQSQIQAISSLTPSLNHAVEPTYEMGWSRPTNGDLLDESEQAGFEVLITTDQNLIHQQNLSNIKLAILILLSTSWSQIEQRLRRAPPNRKV